MFPISDFGALAEEAELPEVATGKKKYHSPRLRECTDLY